MCERPFLFQERNVYVSGLDDLGSVGVYPVLWDIDAFDSSVGPLATLPNGTNDWSQGDVRRFCVWSCHLVFRKLGKDMGTVSGHSMSFVPNGDSESGKSHLLFGYFPLYKT